MAHDGFGDAAEECPRNAAPAVAADHDQVRAPFVRRLDDLFAGRALNDELLEGKARRQHGSRVRQQCRAFLLSCHLELRRGDIDAATQQIGVDRMNNSYKRMQIAREVRPNFERSRSDRAAIRSDQNFPEAHLFLQSITDILKAYMAGRRTVQWSELNSPSHCVVRNLRRTRRTPAQKRRG